MVYHLHPVQKIIIEYNLKVSNARLAFGGGGERCLEGLTVIKNSGKKAKLCTDEIVGRKPSCALKK